MRSEFELRILLAEDNEDHALLTELAVREAQPETAERTVLTTVGDGVEALAYLRGESPHGGRLLPDLILLDLKMPGVSGLDVLRFMREDPQLRVIPVVVLTTSGRDEDVLQAYYFGANEYVTKPVRSEDFRTKVRAIPTYWSRVVQRPPRLSA
jgi:CheY-like chemotaxis protein